MSTLPFTKYKVNERTVSGTVDVENSDVLLNVDTSVVACVINLKSIPNDFWSTMYILYIKDLNGNCATNNITIIAPIGFKINNQQSIVLNVNNVCVTIKIASNTDYNTSYNTQTITSGHIIADEGTLLPQQPILNFVGELVTATDGTGETIVTINNNLRVQNTVYVMKNGSDSTGLIERFDKPFLTINAALNALRFSYPDTVRSPNNRFKVVVEDGTYTENTYTFLYPYIDFDLGNSVINATFIDNFLGVTYSANPNNDFTTKISGNAKINQSLGATFAVTNSNTRLLIECDTISSDKDDCISMSYGYCKAICNLIINNASTSTVGGSLIFCHAIEMTQKNNAYPCVLDIVNATITQGSTSYEATPIHFGTAGYFLTPLNQALNLYNCRVINNNSGGIYGAGSLSAVSVGVTHTEPIGSKLNLYNTVLYSLNGYTIFVSNGQASANLDVYYYNSNSGNNAPYLATTNATHTLNGYIGNLLIDSNVLPIIY